MSRTNAKKEFLGQVAENGVRCAEITTGYFDPEDERPKYLLNEGYTEAEYEAFLTSLDFNYDSGYGGQELYGTIWHMDGTWSEREEYDGSEWWEHREVPPVPDYLKPTLEM